MSSWKEERITAAGQHSIGLESISKKRLKGRVKRDSGTMFEDYFTFRGRSDIRNVISRDFTGRLKGSYGKRLNVKGLKRGF